jgi:hypothetical protein
VKRDPWWNLEAIRDVEKSAGVRSSFFFFAEKGGSRGGRYDVLAIRDELEELLRGGWEVGLHGSYESMVDVERLMREKERLCQTLGNQVTGVRQHYLRLKVPLTVGCMESAGFGYDASLGFSDRAGFRASTCFPFRLYDFEKRRPFTLLEIPFAAMDGALPETPDASRETLERLLDAARQKRGLLSVIWHQRSFDRRDFPGLGPLYDWLLREVGGDHPYFGTHEDVFRWWLKREALGLEEFEKTRGCTEASFDIPHDLLSVALRFSCPVRLREARGVACERTEDPSELLLREIARPGFSLVFEEDDV